MARVVATRARGAEPPQALAFGDHDALVPGGPASAAGRHAAGAPVDMSFFEDDDASLLAELLNECTPRAAEGAARAAAAAPNCLNQAHRRGCTECVAALRCGSGLGGGLRRPFPPQRLGLQGATVLPTDRRTPSPPPQVHPRAEPRGGAPVQAVWRRGAVRSALRRGRLRTRQPGTLVRRRMRAAF